MVISASAAAPGVLVRAENLTLGYGAGAGDQPVLRGLDFAVQAGAMLALVGANGCGKTTLLRALAGLMKPLGGRIVWSDDGGHRGGRAGVLFQNEALAPFTVRELATLGLGINGPPSGAQRGRIAELLASLDLDALAERPCAALSGGELQRARIARALAAEPRLLLLDEPTNHLDPLRRAELLALLGALRGRITLILATHDLELAARADRVLLLGDGGLIALGSPDAVMTPPVLRRALHTTVTRWDPPDGSQPFFRCGQVGA